MPMSQFTGLVLLAGKDSPGITVSLYETLSQFAVKILDIEQVVIRDRLILTTLISLDPAHASAIEGDLLEMANSKELDLAIDFSDLDATPLKDGNTVHISVLSKQLLPSQIGAVAKEIATLGGNIEKIQRTTNYPITAVNLEVAFSDEYANENLIAKLRRAIGQVAKSEKIDVAVESSGLLRKSKRIVMLDMDSTLIKQEVIDLLAQKAGVGDQVEKITERAMNGELDFTASLKERVALLQGLSVEAIAQVATEIELTAGARTLIRTLHKVGHKVGVVSGGFLNVIEPLLKDLQIDFYRANELEIVNGVLTGRTVGQVIDREAKATALLDFARKEGVDLSQSIAIGDGANDLGMIEIAGLGIAFNAKTKVSEVADSSITSPYLDSVLYLIGISEEEVREANRV